MKRKWVACFSQTGSEIVNLANSFNYYPDIAITNNSLDNIHPALINFYKDSPDKCLYHIGLKKIKSDDYKYLFNLIKKPLITLHGWLKIVPAEICNSYEIYNGHPGLINKYPELKGKDPVQRVWASKYKYNEFGSVIHRVTPVVDDGEIIASASHDLPDSLETFDEFDEMQRRISLSTWKDFFFKYI